MLSVCYMISGDLWAGAEVMTYNLLRGMRGHNDISIQAIILNRGRLSDKVRKLQIETTVLDENALSFRELVKAVRDLLTCQPADIIHSHRYKENLLAYLAARSFAATKLVATQHGMPEIPLGPSGMKQRLINWFNLRLQRSKFQAVVVVSEELKQLLAGNYQPYGNKLRVIHNGVGLEGREIRRRDPMKAVVGSCGRFFPVKDYPLMVDVARFLLEKQPGAEFLLAGDGPERRKIESLVDAYRLNDKFQLVGHLDEIDAFYRRLDVYLSTSRHEGIPMSVLEAMSFGIPVVGPRVGGFSEIVEDGVQGFLVSDRSPQAFASRCLNLLSNRALYANMSVASRKRILDDFSLDRMTQQYYNLYLQLIKR